MVSAPVNIYKRKSQEGSLITVKHPTLNEQNDSKKITKNYGY